MVADNTFATPINQNPLALGTDLVLHSATKFLGGHADALGGVLCGHPELVKQVYHYREITGASLDPMAAYLLVRSIKTLALRVRQQNENALSIARWLQEQPAVEAVNYPGLETHLHHDVAARQMRGFGGMLSFSLRGRLRRGQARAAAPAARAPRRQPRRGGDARRAAGHHQPRRVHAPRSARPWASPRGSSATRSASRTRRI